MPNSSSALQCDCKTETPFDYRLPQIGSPTKKDVTCQNCKAVWTVDFKRALDGKIPFTIKLKNISGGLVEFHKQEHIKKTMNTPKKRSPLIVVPGFRKV